MPNFTSSAARTRNHVAILRCNNSILQRSKCGPTFRETGTRPVHSPHDGCDVSLAAEQGGIELLAPATAVFRVAAMAAQPTPQANQPRSPGRRGAWGLHVGRARRTSRRRATLDRGPFRHL